ncbi:MAG: type 4a pilus biogenesis protein PilO [Candidatus Omnitrophica bacterium]|nr:type 4a pilus biogenesis protein PilO [Candidatus Omnitrophota bacterium]MCB9747412.1 type 4a pilus biogenesis protein PilO [Candidatus Omnitrophota bacterium]
MRSFTTREQNIFIFCLILIFVYLGYQGIYKNLQNKSQVLDDEISSMERKIRKDRKTLAEAKAFEVPYEQLVNQFEQKVPNEQVMSNLISLIEEAAGDLDLRISDLKPQRVKRSDTYNRFSVSLTIDSNFAAIMEFLYVLQQDPHNFDVDEFRFDKGSRQDTDAIKSRLVLSKIFIP